MAQQDEIVKGDALQKMGSVGLIIGALLIVVGGVLALGYAADVSNIQEMWRKLGERRVLAQGAELIMALGFLAAMIGTAGVYRSIIGRGAAWARLGFQVLVVGTTLWTVGFALDVAVAAAAANWVAAPDAGKDAAYDVLSAVSAIGRGTFPLGLVFYYPAFAFLGIGMMRSAVYPRSLGWSALILAFFGVPLGIVQTFTGREGSFTLFLVLLVSTTLWFLTAGIWHARKAWRRTAPVFGRFVVEPLKDSKDEPDDL